MRKRNKIEINVLFSGIVGRVRKQKRKQQKHRQEIPQSEVDVHPNLEIKHEIESININRSNGNVVLNKSAL